MANNGRIVKADFVKYLVGLFTDLDIADVLDLDVELVRVAREGFGMSQGVRMVWTKDDHDTLPFGKVPDRYLAMLLRRGDKLVARMRRARGIEPYVSSFSSCDIDWEAAPLGEVTDREIAEAYGVSVTTVYNARRRRGVPSRRDYKRRNDVATEVQSVREPKVEPKRESLGDEHRHKCPVCYMWRECSKTKCATSLNADDGVAYSYRTCEECAKHRVDEMNSGSMFGDVRSGWRVYRD